MGHPTTFVHDAEERLISKIYADGSAEKYAYENTTDRLKSKTDAKGQVTNYQYNADDDIHRRFVGRAVRQSQSFAQVDRGHDLSAQVDQSADFRRRQRHGRDRLIADHFLNLAHFHAEERVIDKKRAILFHFIHDIPPADQAAIAVAPLASLANAITPSTSRSSCARKPTAA